jgi:acetyl/propionyl-CoA carboxylase alpha subunit
MYQPPKGPGVRVDDAYEEGMDIPIFYDPMIAKLIVHAPTRHEAIERLCRAIDEYYIKGIKTTLPFGKWAVQTEPFRNGNFDTKFIDKYFKPELLNANNEDGEEIAAILTAHIWHKHKKPEVVLSATSSVNKWKINRK